MKKGYFSAGCDMPMEWEGARQWLLEAFQGRDGQTVTNLRH